MTNDLMTIAAAEQWRPDIDPTTTLDTTTVAGLMLSLVTATQLTNDTDSNATVTPASDDDRGYIFDQLYVKILFYILYGTVFFCCVFGECTKSVYNCVPVWLLIASHTMRQCTWMTLYRRAMHKSWWCLFAATASGAAAAALSKVYRQFARERNAQTQIYDVVITSGGGFVASAPHTGGNVS